MAQPFRAVDVGARLASPSLADLCGSWATHASHLRVAACLFFLTASLWAQAPPLPEPAIYRSDLDHSAVGFSVRHFVTPVPGRFRDFSATIRHDREDPARSSVEFRVKTASIATDNDDRDAHLRSADFFDAARYPELTFAGAPACGRSKQPGSR